MIQVSIKKNLPQLKNIILLSLFAVTVVNIWLQIFTTASPMGAYGQFGDEAVMTEAAQRIINGQIPHRDFYSFVPGSAYYPLAAWMVIFGEQYDSVRWFNFLSTILLVCSIIWLGYLFSRKIAIMAGLLFAFMIFPLWPFVSYHWQFLLCITLTTRLLLGYRKSIHFILAGILLTFAGLSLPNKTLFTAPVIMGLILLLPSEIHWKKKFFLFMSGPIIFALAITILLSAQHLWTSVWTQLVINNITFYPTLIETASSYDLILAIIPSFLLSLLIFLKPQINQKWRKTYLACLIMHTFLVLSIFYFLEFFHFLLISSFFTILILMSFSTTLKIIWQQSKLFFQTTKTRNISSFIRMITLSILVITVGFSWLYILMYHYNKMNRISPKNSRILLTTPQGTIYVNDSKKITTPSTSLLPQADQLIRTSLSNSSVFFFPYGAGYYYSYKLKNPTAYDILPSPYLPPKDLDRLKYELLKNADILVFLPKTWPQFDSKSPLMQWMKENFPKHQIIADGDIEIYSK